MIRLKNPYAEFPEYSCFGCSPQIHPDFTWSFIKDGGRTRVQVGSCEHFQGFHDILHGGIQATMMDEIASWVVFVILDTAGVTYQLNTRFRKPVLISKGIITVRASLVRQQKRIAEIEVRLYDGEGVLCAEGQANYFVFPREKAVSDMHFPGKEAFLNQM